MDSRLAFKFELENLRNLKKSQILDIFLYNAADQGSWHQWDLSYVLVNFKPNGIAYWYNI